MLNWVEHEKSYTTLGPDVVSETTIELANCVDWYEAAFFSSSSGRT